MTANTRSQDTPPPAGDAGGSPIVTARPAAADPEKTQLMPLHPALLAQADAEQTVVMPLVPAPVPAQPAVLSTADPEQTQVMPLPAVASPSPVPPAADSFELTMRLPTPQAPALDATQRLERSPTLPPGTVADAQAPTPAPHGAVPEAGWEPTLIQSPATVRI